MFNNNYLFIPLIATLTMFIPGVVSAGQISQSFQEPFAYFPLEDEAYVYSNTGLYHAEEPATNQVWQDTGTRLDDFSSYDGYHDYYYFDTNLGYYFDGYSYVGISATHDSDGDEFTAPEETYHEIWRLGSDGTNTTFERVLQLDGSYQAGFSTFLVTDKFLFANRDSDDSNTFWRTANGTDWTEMTFGGLPTATGMEATYFGLGDELYAGTYTTDFATYGAGLSLKDIAIFTSGRGKTWATLSQSHKKLLGTTDPSRSDYGILKIAKYKSKLYALVASGDGGYTVWYTNKTGDWKKSGFTDNESVSLVATKKKLYIYAADNGDSFDKEQVYVCTTRVTSCKLKFEDSYSDDIWINSFMKVGNSAIFLAQDSVFDGEYYLYKP